ncbi:MAG: hypothetical protein FJX23_03240 [Alphaproteobacteria bacterium]|nr:hypothetical protein [Alphaproteobacteria bacterium]
MHIDHISVAAKNLIEKHGLDAEDVATAEYLNCKCPIEGAAKLETLVAVVAGIKLLHDKAKSISRVAAGQ